MFGLRKRRKMTVSELAARTGLSTEQVVAVEGNEGLTIDALKIARELDAEIAVIPRERVDLLAALGLVAPPGSTLEDVRIPDPD